MGLVPPHRVRDRAGRVASDETDEVTVPLGEVAHEPGGDDCHALLRLAAVARGHAAPRVDDEHEVLLPGRHVAAHEG